MSENLLAWLFLALTCGYIPFSDAFAKLLWVRRDLRFTVSLRTGVVFSDRTSVREVSGSGPAASETALRRKILELF